MLAVTMLMATASFGMVAWFVCCARRGAAARRAGFQLAPTASKDGGGSGGGFATATTVPIARIAPDGTSSVVHGVLLGSPVGVVASVAKASVAKASAAKASAKPRGERETLLSEEGKGGGGNARARRR